jgi:hypothetical protein
MDRDFLDLIEHIILRPRMYCPHATSLAVLFTFIAGVCCGHRPPHGSGCLVGLSEYVNARFGKPPTNDCFETLASELQGEPFYDSCKAIVAIFREWRKSIGMDSQIAGF